MGIGTITEARETAGGTAQAGGATAKVAAGGGFDPLKAKVDPFEARKIQIASLRPVAEAMRRHELATKGIEKASATKADIDEIRNGNPNGDGNGNYVGMWRDRNGVWNLPLNSDQLTAEGREEMTRRAQEEIRHRRDQRLAGETNDIRAFVNRETGEDIAAFEGDCEEALLVGRIGENFARVEASVSGDAGAMNSTALGRIGADNAQLKTLKAVGGDAFDAGAAARERTDLWARQYVRQSLEGRMKAAVVLATQSGGLMSPDAAMKRANAIYDGQASELMRRLVEAGEYDRARTFVGHAEELGYSDAVKAKAMEDIDAAEISLATANGLKAYGTVWDENGELIPERDKVLDAQIATLKRVAENAPKGSRTAIAALQQAERFEDAADSIAYGDLIDRIAGRDPSLFDVDKNGKATLKEKPFDKKSQPRAARLWPKAVEACERKRSTAFNSNHKEYVAESRKNALQTIANPNGNPQAYVSWLIGEMENGNLDANDVIDETNRFRSMWINGTGDGQKSRMQIIARQMLDDTKSILGVDFGSSVSVDAFGNPALDKNGALSFRKDANKPSVDYIRWKSAEELAEESRNNPSGNAYPKTSHSFSADEWLEIMNMACKLSMANGAMINEIQLDNPLWNLYGDAMKDLVPNDAKTIRRVDAVRDFRTYLERLKKGKDVLGAAEELELRRTDFNLVNDTVIRRTDPFVMRQRNTERGERRPGPWKE